MTSTDSTLPAAHSGFLQRARDGLQNVLAGLGTNRDKMAYNEWSAPRTFEQVELENMYRTSWLAKRIVNAVADDMTRAGRELNNDSDSSNNAHEKIEAAEKQLCVWLLLNEALRWSRLYGGAIMVIGTKDGKLEEPLEVKSIKQGDLKYLYVFDRWRIGASGVINMDFGSPNFGMPEHYIVGQNSSRVHHSRCIRFDGQKLPYLLWQKNAQWHDSELIHIMDSVMNLSTTNAAIATMMFEANVDVVTGGDIAMLLSQKDGESKLQKRFLNAAMMKSFNRMLLLDANEKYEKKGNNFANLDAVQKGFMVDVCGAADIPMARLFGQSAGGLNGTGEGDIRNYYDMVSAKQEAELRPALEKLDEVLVRHALGEIPNGYEFKFKSLWQMSDKDRAAIEKTDAERDAIYIQNGVITEGVAANELLARGTYTAMTKKDVNEVESLAKEIPKEAIAAQSALAKTDKTKVDE
jgi:uncharacterized protein